MPPYVGAIVVNEDGDVADHLDAALRAVAAQSAPLLEEGKLHHALNFQFALVLEAKLMQPLGLAPGQLFGPGTPGHAAADIASDFEQHKIIQPPGDFLLDALKLFAIALAGLEKVLGGLA